MDGIPITSIDSSYIKCSWDSSVVIHSIREMFEMNFRHYQEPKVLLTTEDSVEITDSKQKIYSLSPTFTDKYDCSVGNFKNNINPAYKAFSTPEARDEYIMRNKRLFSLEDMHGQDKCPHGGQEYFLLEIDKLEKLARERIKS